MSVVSRQLKKHLFDPLLTDQFEVKTKDLYFLGVHTSQDELVLMGFSEIYQGTDLITVPRDVGEKLERGDEIKSSLDSTLFTVTRVRFDGVTAEIEVRQL